MLTPSTLEPRIDPDRAGYVYVLLNPAMPDLVKIGETRRGPYSRATELSRPTGVPRDFQVIYSARVADSVAVEKLLHAALATRRVTTRKEFFAVPPTEAIDALLGIVRSFRPLHVTDLTIWVRMRCPGLVADGLQVQLIQGPRAWPSLLVTKSYPDDSVTLGHRLVLDSHDMQAPDGLHSVYRANQRRVEDFDGTWWESCSGARHLLFDRLVTADSRT